VIPSSKSDYVAVEKSDFFISTRRSSARDYPSSGDIHMRKPPKFWSQSEGDTLVVAVTIIIALGVYLLLHTHSSPRLVG
jgi:hypothetical protein